MKTSSSQEPLREANQTVRLQIDGKGTSPSSRISFTDQRRAAHGGMIVWSHFLRQVLPHAPTRPNDCRPNACRPDDPALVNLGGILCGADIEAHCKHDPRSAY